MENNYFYRFLKCITLLLITTISLVFSSISYSNTNLSKEDQQWLTSNPEIIVTHDEEWKPYSYVHNGKSVGFTIDLMKLIAERTGLKVTFTSEQWEKAYSQTKAGNADVILDIIKTAEREKNTFLFTDTYAKNPNAIIVNKGQPFSKINDLKNKKVAFVKGSFLKEFLNKNNPEIITIAYDNSLSALKALQFGDVDAVVSRIIVANQLISEYSLFDLTISFELPTDQLDMESMRMAVLKSKPELHRILNFGLSNISKNEWAELQQQWLSSEIDTADQPTRKTGFILVGFVIFAIMILLIPIILNKHITDETIKKLSQNKTVLISGTVISIILIIVLYITNFSLNKIQNQSRSSLQIAISGINNAINTNLDMWINERLNYINVLSNDQDLLMMVEEALTVPANKKEIEFSTSLIDLRVFFASLQAIHGDNGFFIISKDRINIASMRNVNLGEVNLIHQQRPDILDDVFNGQARFIPPVKSDINSLSSLFFAAPIFNNQGEVIAVVTLRNNPSYEFSRLFSSTHIGKTTDSYAFDNQGNIISTLRFEDTLHNLGLLEKEKNSILNTTMRTPNINLLETNKLNENFKYGDYSKAFILSKTELSGHSNIGYTNYLGDVVLGSWVWSDTHKVGFVTEISESEALQSYVTTRNIIITLLILTIMLAVGLTSLSLWLSRRTQDILKQSNEQLENHVKERTAKLSSIIDTASDGIIVLNEVGEITEFSPAAEHIFGYSKNAVLNKNFSTVFSCHCHGDAKWLDKVMSKNQTVELEIEALHFTGLVLPLEFSIAKASLSNSFIYTCIVRDITERKQATMALESAKDQAEEATKSKSDFLANMSHEIRTPMNAIIGMSYLALQTDLNPKQYDYVNKILNASNSLLGILNDILDFSKIEAGKFDIECIPFSLEEIMNNITSLMQIKIQEKELELLIYVDPKLPLSFKGDPLRIGQILTNLVSNSVKFTESGEIIIKVELSEETDSHFLINFSVKDSGIGMTEKQMSKLFSAFNQADSSTTRKFGGTGLGLTITKNLVEMMDGTISCQSAPNEGSTFSFTIRLEKDTSQLHLKDNHLPSELQDIRVLIVDDIPDSLEILLSIANELQLNSNTAADGISALTEIMKADRAGESYDLILLDYHMPNLNGADTIESIEKLNLSNNPRIIMVSSYSQDQIRQKNNTVYFDSFLAKPATSSTLLDSIKSIYQSIPATTSMDPTSTILHGSKIDPDVMGAKILLVEDNLINQQVATELLSIGKFEISIANDGNEAINSFNEGEFDLVLMDLQMPVMDGYQATDYIRNTLNDTETPIIAMTANAMKEDVTRCLESGMNDHIAKPIEPLKLYESINSWIEKKNRGVSHDAAENETETSKFEIPFIEGFDTKQALERMANNHESWHRALRNAIKSQRKLSKNLVEAVKNNNDDIKIFAHTLKGVFGNLAHERIFQLAGHIEQQQNNNELTTLSEVEHLDRQIQSALDSVETYLSSIEVPNETKVNITIEQLEHLDELLQNYDTDAIDFCEKIQLNQQSSDHKKLHDAISLYDFDTALEILNNLKKALL